MRFTSVPFAATCLVALGLAAFYAFTEGALVDYGAPSPEADSTARNSVAPALAAPVQREAPAQPLKRPSDASELSAGATQPLSKPDQRPSWLGGQTDLSPANVLRVWEGYAATQGRRFDSVKELVAYAKANPSRVGDAADGWAVAVAASPSADLAVDFVTAGYLDAALSKALGDPKAEGYSRAQADVQAFKHCLGSQCVDWTPLFMLADDPSTAALAAMSTVAQTCDRPATRADLLAAARMYGESRTLDSGAPVLWRLETFRQQFAASLTC